MSDEPANVYEDSFGFKTRSAAGYVNKQRVFVAATRSITKNQEFLFKNLKLILPHSKSDSKFEKKNI